jgi:hypothetical protein
MAPARQPQRKLPIEIAEVWDRDGDEENLSVAEARIVLADNVAVTVIYTEDELASILAQCDAVLMSIRQRNQRLREAAEKNRRIA